MLGPVGPFNLRESCVLREWPAILIGMLRCQHPEQVRPAFDVHDFVYTVARLRTLDVSKFLISGMDLAGSVDIRECRVARCGWPVHRL